MKHKCTIVVAALLVLSLLLTTPLLGCGDDEEGDKEEKRVITIGTLTDLTGPAGPALITMLWALEDVVRHTNEEDPIPGVELKVIAYDGKMDPSRTLPGYEWMKERGMDVFFPVFDYDSAIVEPFAEKDKNPVFTFQGYKDLIDPPGWVFVANTLRQWSTPGAMKWVGEEWDTTEGVLKIGCIGILIETVAASEKALEEYCQDHPDRYEYVDGFLVPFGTSTWGGEIEKLKDCDWIVIPGSSFIEMVTFLEQFRARGYTAKILGGEDVPSYMDLIVNKLGGWELLDGSVFWIGAAWWSDPYPVVDFIKGLLYEYRPGDAEETIRSGVTYLGGGMQQYFYIELIRAAVEEVGAENLDGQALYNTAVKFKMTMEDYDEWGFTETVRACNHYITMHEASAEAEDLVFIDRVPVIEN